jgi:hypothetical protein
MWRRPDAQLPAAADRSKLLAWFAIVVSTGLVYSIGGMQQITAAMRAASHTIHQNTVSGHTRCGGCTDDHHRTTRG